MTSELHDLISALPDARREDAGRLLELFERATGQPPVLAPPSIVGFGRYEFRYASGRSGSSAAAGFAPRGREISIYLADGVQQHAELLALLGRHRVGVGCLYLTRLDGIDLDVLERIVRTSYQRLTSGTYLLRARDGGATAPPAG